jgi:uncharacterized protein (TIGR00730 family)
MTHHEPEKAYENLTFLHSPSARTIRMLCEYEEPRQRLAHHGIHDTVVMFGSARARPRDDVRPLLEEAEARVRNAPGDVDASRALEEARVAMRLAGWYEDARELGRRLTEWSLYRDGRRPYVVATGGGPGIMEAANRGASEVEGGRSVGLGISLPFEPGVNRYVTKELAFEFHYFFMRKLWFVYLMKACVIFPGGFGTLDELFEVLTLVQTRKVKKRIPIVLFGTAYWERVLDLEAMAELGTIGRADVLLVHRTDDVDDAFRYLVGELARIESGAAR